MIKIVVKKFSLILNYELLTMKYIRLTKEQFEELHTEFANFLAAQSIDKADWVRIKTEEPDKLGQQLDLFSDLIWDEVLSKANYLEHFSKNHIFLFRCFDNHIESIVLKSADDDIDFLTQRGLLWLNDNLFSNAVEIKVGKKAYSGNRNIAIFDLIQQGAFLSEGNMYEQIHAVIVS